MGALLCRSTELVVNGKYEMPGVTAEIAEETFRDLLAAPTFVPDLLHIEFVRGAPAQVGACWNERRKFGRGEMVIRKTITKISSSPFEVREVMEATGGNGCTLPNFIATFTISIVSTPAPLKKVDGNGKNNRNCCTVLWHDAFLSTGMSGRLLSALCFPVLKRSCIASIEEEMRCYYEECLRRMIDAEKTESSNE